MSEMDWKSLSEIDDEPDEDAYHALLWGRLHVRGIDRTWITDWKVLKASWVRWLGSRVNGSAKHAGNWWHHDDAGARIERIEASHYMPLPEGPPE